MPRLRQPGVAVASEIIHESNFAAIHQVEIMVGADKIVRINIDGVCALRVRASQTCAIVIQDDFSIADIIRNTMD